MRVFVSWSGARSKAVAAALRHWLPAIIPGIEFFHSEDIPKGENWHNALIEALRGCGIGIFCVTPEALRSPWLQFEAGAMAQHGDRPRLFAYLFAVDKPSGPLAAFQATRFDRASTRDLAGDLAELLGAGDPEAARARFDDVWDTFEAEVRTGTAVPAQQLLPELTELFDRSKKTFHEPFPECSNTRWDDRLRRTSRTHAYLARPEVGALFHSDAFLRQGYDALLAALARYDMHIGSFLLDRRDYERLPDEEQRMLEDARKLVLEITATLCRTWPPPILPESRAFETERSPDARKAVIHAVEHRIRRGGFDAVPLHEHRAVWALDRIARYLAWGAGLLPQVGIDDMIDALRVEEEDARTRSLVTGLQPLYYAAEAIDESLDARPAGRTATRLADALAEVQLLLDAHPGRDTGGHIRRRIESIREKMADQR